MRREEYLHTLTEQIRCKMARGTIEQEINDHIEDQKEEFLSEGMSQTEGEDAGRLIYELTAKARKLPFLKGQEIVPVLFLKQKPLRESDALVITPQEIIDAIG